MGGYPRTAWSGANLDRWGQKYMAYLKTIRQRGRRVVLNWEAFVAEPARHMRRLSTELDIVLEPALLEHVRLGHFIGGSTGIDVRALEGRSEARLARVQCAGSERRGARRKSSSIPSRTG